MLRKLTSPSWKRSFLNTFRHKTGFNIPYQYVKFDDVYAYLINNEIVGGFAIVDNTPQDCRLLQQIADDIERTRIQCDFYYRYEKITELTCYFINDPKYSIPIKFGMMLRCLRYPAKRFFYSYELHKKHLQNYYALGKPTIHYRGPVKKLEGMSDNPKDESVESLTKVGIIKIFILSSLGQIKRSLKNG